MKNIAIETYGLPKSTYIPLTRMQIFTRYSPMMMSRNSSASFNAAGTPPLRRPRASLTMTVHSSPEPFMGNS